jgi:serine/threonine protein kinase
VNAPGYRTIELLRRGRDLDVYDVWSEERACRCVIKAVRPDRLHRDGAGSRLLDEGRLLCRLTHPHIVRGYEVCEEPFPMVVLETLAGETLGHMIDRGAALSVPELAQLGLHLCSAIRYLHGHGVLHLDLKPSNVIAECGRAKLIDLSVARPPGSRRAGARSGPPPTSGGSASFCSRRPPENRPSMTRKRTGKTATTTSP